MSLLSAIKIDINDVVRHLFLCTCEKDIEMAASNDRYFMLYLIIKKFHFIDLFISVDYIVHMFKYNPTHD